MASQMEEGLIDPLLHHICVRSPPSSQGSFCELEEIFTPDSPLQLPTHASLARKLRPKPVADPLLDAQGQQYNADALFR